MKCPSSPDLLSVLWKGNTMIWGKRLFSSCWKPSISIFLNLRENWRSHFCYLSRLFTPLQEEELSLQEGWREEPLRKVPKLKSLATTSSTSRLSLVLRCSEKH